MTVLYEKLQGPDGALKAISNLDKDIELALETYGPPPDRSLPATFQTLAGQSWVSKFQELPLRAYGTV